MIASLTALLLAAAGGPEVRFEVRDLSGTGAHALPVTLSALLDPGLFHDDDVAVVVRGAAGAEPRVVPAQLDVLSRHGDGSLQHALVTVALDLAPREAAELYLVPSPSKPLVGALADAMVAGPPAPPVLVELVDERGVHFTLLLEPPPLDVKPAGRAAGPLFGPLAQEVEAVGRLKSGAGELANVEVRARWGRLAGVPGARVEVAVENCPAPGVRRATGVAPDDVPFQRLAIFAGDVALCDLPRGVLHDRTRCAVRRFVGPDSSPPPRLIVRQDLLSLIRGGWLPPIDARQPVAEVTATELARRMCDGDAMNGDVNPAEFPLGIPFNSGPIVRAMHVAGDRGDIGAIPNWAMVALNSRSVLAEDVLLAADMNGAAAFPIHVRDEAGTMGLQFGPAAPLEKRKTRLECPCEPDRAHAPLLGYVTFLMTGDRFAEEEFAAQAAYCFYEWPHDGGYAYPGTRDFAWSLRTTMLAARVLPDDHPLKAYFGTRVAENLAVLRGRIIVTPGTPLHTWGWGSAGASGRATWPCATEWSPWQAAWVAGALWWTDRMLGNADARALYEWQVEYFLRAYASVGSTWTAPEGTVVTWTSGHDALAYSFPVATYTPTIVNGEWKPIRESRRLIDSFPEALWWLRVNLDHEFDPGRNPTMPVGPDGVPTLPPEQWRPKRGWSPPPTPEDYWVVYAMHWLAAIVEADGIEGGHAVWTAVKPSIDRQIRLPGLRMAPELLRER